MRGIDSRAWSANLTALNYWQCGQKMPNTLILNYIVGLPKELLSGRDADLVVMVDCQIPSDDLIVHFF